MSKNKKQYKRLIKERPFCVHWTDSYGLDIKFIDLELRGRDDNHFWSWVNGLNSGRSFDGTVRPELTKVAVWRGLHYPIMKVA